MNISRRGFLLGSTALIAAAAVPSRPSWPPPVWRPMRINWSARVVFATRAADGVSKAVILLDDEDIEPGDIAALARAGWRFDGPPAPTVPFRDWLAAAHRGGR